MWGVEERICGAGLSRGIEGVIRGRKAQHFGTIWRNAAKKFQDNHIFQPIVEVVVFGGQFQGLELGQTISRFWWVW